MKVKTKAREKQKMPTKDKVLITIFSIIITLSILCVAAVFLLNSRFLKNSENNEGGTGLINENIVTPDAVKEKAVNILVAGIDYVEGSGRGKLTDVVMLVSFDIEAKNVDILQIPRDSYIGEDYPTGKINAIYGQKTNGGISGLADRINKTFRLTIDHYVTINMDTFITIVDKIGGVTLDVPKRIDLEGTTLLPGTQTLTGKQAEIFVRERKSYANGDLGRIEMQKIFLEALLKKVFTLGNAKIASLAPTLIGDVTTDLSIAEALGYFNKLTQVDMENDINFHLLPVIGSSHGGLSVLSIKKLPTADLLNEYFRPYLSPIPAEDLGIIELNKDYAYPEE